MTRTTAILYLYHRDLQYLAHDLPLGIYTRHIPGQWTLSAYGELIGWQPYPVPVRYWRLMAVYLASRRWLYDLWWAVRLVCVERVAFVTLLDKLYARRQPTLDRLLAEVGEPVLVEPRQLALFELGEVA